MTVPTFSERLRRRNRIWWGPLRPLDPRSWRARLHREREWYALRSRDDPDAAWRCCALWPRTLIQKWNGREFARRHGLPVPELYRRGYPLGRLRFEALPRDFVVRPVKGHGRRGVYVMADGFELLRQRALSPRELRRRIRRQSLAAWTLPLLVEERVRPPDGSRRLPVEYKCYAFGGTVAAVAVIHRTRLGEGGASTRMYTPAWEPWSEPYVDNLPEAGIDAPPDFLAEMMALAERVGAAAGTYLRVDFFAGERGCVFNEFSSVPGGGLGYTRAADEYLGAAWQRAVPDSI